MSSLVDPEKVDPSQEAYWRLWIIFEEGQHLAMGPDAHPTGSAVQMAMDMNRLREKLGNTYRVLLSKAS